jgi:hypothetical protein
VEANDHQKLDRADSPDAPVAKPVVLRWDAAEGVAGIAKLIFPVDTANEAEKASLDKLVAACVPASFGYKGEEVLNDAYRKATKLEPSAFSSSFCPYELGIIDTIAQVLLPNTQSNIKTHGVRAELYKLNVSLTVCCS